MRTRVMERGAAALADYEIVEMLLFLGIPRRDTKPLAKLLINRFGSLVAVLEASEGALRHASLNTATIASLRMPMLAARRLAEAETRSRPLLGNWEALLAYFDTALDGAVAGQLRVLFLDNRNRLLGDETILDARPLLDVGTGAIASARRSPKIEAAIILRRALALHATALIGVRLCHDVEDPEAVVVLDQPLARELAGAGALLAVTVHDMFALRGGLWSSLKQRGKL